MSQIKSGFGHVYTSRVQNSINAGKGVFDPNKIKWTEDSSGSVFVDGTRVRVIGNGKTDLAPPIPTFDEVTYDGYTWTADYISVDDGGEGIYNDQGIYRYTQEAAIRVAGNIPGWSLISSEVLEHYRDETVNGSRKYASTTGWTYQQGTNESGLDLYPLGYYINLGGEDIYAGVGTESLIWTSTEGTCLKLYQQRAIRPGTYTWKLVPETTYHPAVMMPLRLIKDS